MQTPHHWIIFFFPFHFLFACFTFTLIHVPQQIIIIISLHSPQNGELEELSLQSVACILTWPKVWGWKKRTNYSVCMVLPSEWSAAYIILNMTGPTPEFSSKQSWSVLLINSVLSLFRTCQDKRDYLLVSKFQRTLMVAFLETCRPTGIIMFNPHSIELIRLFSCYASSNGGWPKRSTNITVCSTNKAGT